MRISVRQALSLFLCLALSISLAACGASVPSSTLPVEPPSPTAADPEPTAPQTDPPTQPVTDPSPAVTNAPASPAVTDTPAPTPENSPSVEITDPPVESSPVVEEPTYYFGTPLAESEPVEDTHFDSAVFLGDSRTEGLQLFGGIRHGDYYWARGMTVFRVDDPNYAVFEIDEQKYTMIGALRQKEYQSVYIMIGVNELGYAASSYEKGLRDFVDLVLEAQPNAVVYLQILPPVNEEVAQKNGLADYINNANIGRFNEAIVRIAAEKKIVLLDTAEVYRDENGILPAEMASDGCHFNFNGYIPWANYLRNHVMSAEEYHYNRGLEVTQSDPADSPEPTGQPADEPSADPTVEPSVAPAESPSTPPDEEVDDQ